jgi:hypothetical protein
MTDETSEELIDLFEHTDSEESAALYKKVNGFILTLQEHVTDQLMLTFTGEELALIQDTYGDGFHYRMLPDVQYILAGPGNGTIH